MGPRAAAHRAPPNESGLLLRVYILLPRKLGSFVFSLCCIVKLCLSMLHVCCWFQCLSFEFNFFQVLIMKIVSHPNIVNLIEVIDDPDTDYFYMGIIVVACFVCLSTH